MTHRFHLPSLLTPKQIHERELREQDKRVREALGYARRRRDSNVELLRK